jgi:hypothetical protein
MRYALLLAALVLSLCAKAVYDLSSPSFSAPRSPQSAVANERFAAQIGAFESESAALAFAAEARKRYSDMPVVLRVLKRGFAPYLVWISGFSSAEEAKKYIEKNAINAFVVKDR